MNGAWFAAVWRRAGSYFRKSCPFGNNFRSGAPEKFLKIRLLTTIGAPGDGDTSLIRAHVDGRSGCG
jgi:hypothetical protein